MQRRCRVAPPKQQACEPDRQGREVADTKKRDHRSSNGREQSLRKNSRGRKPRQNTPCSLGWRPTAARSGGGGRHQPRHQGRNGGLRAARRGAKPPQHRSQTSPEAQIRGCVVRACQPMLSPFAIPGRTNPVGVVRPARQVVKHEENSRESQYLNKEQGIAFCAMEICRISPRNPLIC